MRFASALVAVLALQDAVPLRFEFKAGDREDLRFDLDMTMNMELASDAVQMKQALDGKILFTLKSVCSKADDEGYAFNSTFSDLDMDQKVAVGDKKITVIVKGKAVKMTDQDGQVLVDTEEKIHPQLAGPVLKELGGFGEELELRMDARGLLRDPEKGKPLPKLLQGVGSSGNLHPFVLPEKPVRVGDEWVHENEMTSLGELKLVGKSIKIPIKYRLERVEGEGASRVAVFSSKVDAAFKDIECAGKMNGVDAEISLKIATLSYKGSGETRFLPASGRMAKSFLDFTVTSDMAAESEELGGKMAMKMLVGLKVRVAPAGAKKRDF